MRVGALIISLIIFCLVFGGFTLTIVAENKSVRGLQSHAPIYISGNSDFSDDDDDGVSNPDAAGTERDPYIIEGWDINGGGRENGIEIRETDVCFVIRNCRVHNAEHGISFFVVKNGVIENTTSYNNSFSGIRVGHSNNNKITDCQIYNNSKNGIFSYRSSENQITNCRIYNHSYEGIYFRDFSKNNTVSNCNVYNNKKGFVLWKSSDGNNITGCLIYHNLEEGIQVGISIGSYYYPSHDNYITNCHIYNNPGYGIYLLSSLGNNISTCQIHNNTHGICLHSSSKNCIGRCKIYNNWYGIWLRQSSNNSLSSCQLYNNYWDGVYFDDSSDDNIIRECALYNNDDGGIYVDTSSNNEIHYCNIYNNTDYGVCNFNTESRYEVDAANCWWGAIDGPGGVGPGNGNNVSNNVVYDPWLTEPVNISLPSLLLKEEEGVTTGAVTDEEREGEGALPEKPGFNIIYPAVGGAVAVGIIIAVFLLRRRAAAPESKIPAPKPEVIAPSQIPIITLRCPQCKNTFEIESKERPFKVKCQYCGKEGEIK